MSISNDMITLLKNDIDDVYKAGQNSVMDESRVIKKTASGVGFLHLNDVSEIPHNIKCKVESANHFGLELLTGEMVNISGVIASNVPYTVENGVITNNKAVYYATYFLCTTPFKLEAGSYKLSFKTKKNRDDGSLSIITRLMFSDGTVTGLEENAAKIEVYNEEVYVKVAKCYEFNEEKIVTGICLQCVGKKDDTVNDVDDTQMQFWDIMFNKGTEALPYAPYGLSANTNVTVCGKNLFDGGDINVTRYFRRVYEKPLPAGTYTFSAKLEAEDRDSSDNIFVTFCSDTLGEVHNGNRVFFHCNTQNSYTFTSSVPIRSIGLYAADTYSNGAGLTVTYSNIQLERGSVATPYESYSAKTFTSNTDGSIDGIMSTDANPIMNIFTGSNVNIIAEYNKSYGMQTEYDRFWDSFQEYGNKTSYTNVFAGSGWTNETFKPKYSIIKPISAYMMFRSSVITGTLDDLCTVDFSECTMTQYAFALTNILEINFLIDLSSITSANNASYMFQSSSIKKIGNLKIPETLEIKHWFDYCTSLKDLTINGIIGQNGLDVHWSPLSHDSIMSIINALKDYSEDTSGTSWVVTFGDANLAKITDVEKAIAIEKGWTLV